MWIEPKRVRGARNGFQRVFHHQKVASHGVGVCVDRIRPQRHLELRGEFVVQAVVAEHEAERRVRPMRIRIESNCAHGHLTRQPAMRVHRFEPIRPCEPWVIAR